MPLVRIDLHAATTDAFRATVGDVVYDAMRTTLEVPEDDRFQIFHQHSTSELMLDPTYLGIERGEGCLVIQVTLNIGRTVAMKQAFYKAVADGLQQRLQVRGEDVFISLVEVAKENWSFGHGLAQYADPA